jgi:hypothetical protein
LRGKGYLKRERETLSLSLSLSHTYMERTAGTADENALHK